MNVFDTPSELASLASLKKALLGRYSVLCLLLQGKINIRWVSGSGGELGVGVNTIIKFDY